ncbi:hypothetical protein GOBAR_AA15984 [Gossypium barbadense]|uniref:GH3 auxin-responsive promoter n=1 Tax=Gossypium barbadense TaxID=3634 RepID=A0A2P5XMW5_GOSBA|nr:hypothetical protein GOBAR_AA15984 [Gossypium barbadense]
MATNGYECGLKLIKELTTNTEQIQDEVLREILSQNAGTEYLRGFLHGQIEKQLSKKNVPVVTYEDLKPYIDRIANRETSEILLAKPVTRFYLSSETSGGQPKLILVTAKYQKNGALYGTLNQSPTMRYGLIPISLFQFFIQLHLSLVKTKLYTSPIETNFCPDPNQGLYCQLLFGLIQRDEVVKVGSLFASVLLRGIKFLENHWQKLCYDIKTGRLSDWITDSGCRDAASLVMKPNPEQADLIENICNFRKLWPKARYIYCVCTGIMRQYIAELEFYCRGIPLVSTSYACSEAICVINLEPLCKPCDVSYTFLPNIDTELVDLVNVKVGQCYELVVSTCAGKIGDVLMVSGFYNNAPQFQFVERKNVILSVDQEKTSETDLFKAITEAKALLDPLGFILTEYTSYVDTSSAPGHYSVALEWKSHCIIHIKSIGKWNIIAALEIRVVKQGSFEVLMDYYVSKGTSLSQYKKPSCIKSEEALKILDSRVIGKYFSHKSPL